MQEGAARSRGRATARPRSLLCGRIFDETGDRLTPSHSKTRTGVRLRYYISHRLIAKSGEANLDGWRLPAEELETKIAELVRSLVSAPSFAGRIAPGARAEEIGRVRSALQKLVADDAIKSALHLVARVDVMPGEIRIGLDPDALANALRTDREVLCEEALQHSFPFRLRKRGVETKLILADSPTGIDEKLIRNIAMAHRWFEQIKAGRTFTEIAEAESASKRRIQQMIDLAFLAPDIIRDVLEGRQPLGFTSDWCLRHTLPSDWADQRRLLATF